MILLDTHVVIWLMTSPDLVSKRAAKAIEKAGTEGMLPGISAATMYELFYLKRRGRIQLHLTDAAILERMREWFELIPITATIAVEAAALPDPFHGDPIDRLIAATARVEGRTLITADRKIHESNVCKVRW
ncbi:MAG: type II toxin-antitoxin system VapC family toxin [Terracidiphilus sp.]